MLQHTLVINTLYLRVCDLHTAATSLIHLGFFPCAPKRPSLAVDLNLLDLIRLYSLYTSPNITGWSQTIETYLKARGHTLRTDVCHTYTLSFNDQLISLSIRFEDVSATASSGIVK